MTRRICCFCESPFPRGFNPNEPTIFCSTRCSDYDGVVDAAVERMRTASRGSQIQAAFERAFLLPLLGERRANDLKAVRQLAMDRLKR